MHLVGVNSNEGDAIESCCHGQGRWFPGRGKQMMGLVDDDPMRPPRARSHLEEQRQQLQEKRGPIRGRTVAWSGDANNVLASWMHAAERFDFQLRVATPAELRPKKWLMDWVKSSGAAIMIGDDPDAAVKDADCVVTDTWVSMGDRDGKLRHNILKRYQVNGRLMAKAKPDALFMHCLPAHRGEEVTDEVIDGPQSVVFDEAENRLHAQKGLLAWCLQAGA